MTGLLFAHNQKLICGRGPTTGCGIVVYLDSDCGFHNGLSGRQSGVHLLQRRGGWHRDLKENSGQVPGISGYPARCFCVFVYAPHISYYHSVSHVPDVHTDNSHGELVPACSLDKSIKSAIL